MDLTPKDEDQIMRLDGKLPVTLDEAVAYLNSKFKLVGDSDMMYEEFPDGNGDTVRAVHITYAMGAKIESQDTISTLIAGWLTCMMDRALNSKCQRLFWRMKPQLKIVRTDFPDGSAWAVEIFSRSSMI